MTGILRRQIHCHSDECGVAMLEFVLMLPFIWVILALVLNFGLALLERQRTMVAVREVGIRHTAQFASTPEAQLAPVVDQVIAQNLAHRNMTAQVVDLGDDGECPRDGEGVDRGPVEDAFRKFQDFFESISASRSYLITAQGQPLIGPLLPDDEYSMCFAIDGSPWTKTETGGPLDWLKNLVGGIASKIF